MKKRLFILLPLLLHLLCSSCLRDVVLKLDPVPSLLVLNASVTPDREVAAFLSKSWFLLDSVPQYLLPEKDVNIDVYVNDVFRGTMQRSDNPEDSTEYKGQYKLPGCYVKAGDKVRFEAEAPEFAPVAGETKIPQKSEIAALDTAFYSNTYNMYVYLTLRDNPSERNYYRLVVERLDEYHKGDSVMWKSQFFDDKGYRVSISGDRFEVDNNSFFNWLSLTYDDPVFQPDIPSMDNHRDGFYRGIFSDDLFNGKEYAVAFSFYPDYSFVTDTLSATVHYDIHLLSISEDYYNYLKVIRNFSILLGDTDMSGQLEPTASYSNVTNGFGVVTGYQKSTRRITMPVGSVPPYWGW